MSEITNNNNKNNNGRRLLDGGKGTGDRLRRSSLAPLTEADKASWERWAETAFCSLMQNAGYTQDHDTLVREAGLIADTFVNMAKERFDLPSEAANAANVPSTNVFTHPSFVGIVRS